MTQPLRLAVNDGFDSIALGGLRLEPATVASRHGTALGLASLLGPEPVPPVTVAPPGTSVHDAKVTGLEAQLVRQRAYTRAARRLAKQRQWGAFWLGYAVGAVMLALVLFVVLTWVS